MRKRHISIVDNDPLAVSKMKELILRADKLMDILWTEEDGSRAIQRCLYDSVRPDVLIVDMALQFMSGADVIRSVRPHCPDMGIICVTAYPREVYMDDAVQGGAQALLTKRSLQTELAGALRAVGDGEAYTPREGFLSVADSVVRARQNVAVVHELTNRERQVLKLSILGKSTSQIAEIMHITENTVFSHRHHIERKLGEADWSRIVADGMRSGSL